MRVLVLCMRLRRSTHAFHEGQRVFLHWPTGRSYCVAGKWRRNGRWAHNIFLRPKAIERYDLVPVDVSFADRHGLRVFEKGDPLPVLQHA